MPSARRNKKWKSRHHPHANSTSQWQHAENYGQVPISLSPEDEKKANDEVDKLFSKCYVFSQQYRSEWQLPHNLGCNGNQKWSDPKLQSLKVKLNETKSRLSELDITLWHRHTNNRHLGGEVLHWLRKNIHPELLTQAWCKFWEVLGCYDLVQNFQSEHLKAQHLETQHTQAQHVETQHTQAQHEHTQPQHVETHHTQAEHTQRQDNHHEFCSLHLCEAPGAFVTSLNHFIKNTVDIKKWTWLSTTLNPYHEGNNVDEMIIDDRFIFDTLENWNFGADDTGNLLHWDNVQQLLGYAHSQKGQINLVTADGSIDCANNPAEQEKQVAVLIRQEILTALCVLAPHGHLVVKMFTLFEDTSVALLYLLCCCFGEVHVIKPVTSKPGNSEVYVVAKDYSGLSEAVTTQLFALTGDHPILDCSSIPKSYLAAHRQCCELFTGCQVETILTNIEANKLPIQPMYLERCKELCREKFIQKYPIRHIPNRQRIVPYAKHAASARSDRNPLCKPRHEGSYSTRVGHHSMPWPKQVETLDFCEVSTELSLFLLQGSTLLENEDISQWHSVYGQPYTTVNTSRFCQVQLLSLYNNFLQQSMSVRMHVREELYAKWLHETVFHLVSSIPCIDAAHVLPLNANSKKLAAAFSKHTQEPDAQDTAMKKLFCWDPYRCEMTESDWLTSNAHWSELAAFMEKVKEGDDVALVCPPLLTRLNAGLLLLLQATFSQVAVYVPPSPAMPVCLVLASNHLHPSPNSLIPYLKNISSATMISSVDTQQSFSAAKESADGNCESSSESTGSLLATVPIQLLHEPEFYCTIHDINNTYIQRRINLLLKQEKQLQQTLNS